jgi:hypothetical protein
VTITATDDLTKAYTISVVALRDGERSKPKTSERPPE